MNNNVKMISAAAATLVVAVGIYKTVQFGLGYTPASVELARLKAEKQANADVVQARVSVLAKDGCQASTMAILELHARTPVRAIGDLPGQLGDDLVLCLERGIMSAYLEGTLKDAGLLKILKPAS